MDRIKELRHILHKYPEVSNREFETSNRIAEFIKKFSPDQIIDVAITGKAFIFKGKDPGKSLVFRAELDALPIQEMNDLPYASQKRGVAHLCGHDGHMAILAGLARRISDRRPEKGKVILLFQPAEEVEQGAKDVVEDKIFQDLKPDYVFALHNIPGIEKNKILLKNGSFAAASKGMTIKLFGKTSHAGEPEKGINPDVAISKIIAEFHKLAKDQEGFSDYTLMTIIHIILGEISFGTSPGYAEIRATLRAFENKDMHYLVRKAENIVSIIAEGQNLKYKIFYSEDFPAVINNTQCVEMIEASSRENFLNYEYLKSPFRWSEDFSYFTQKYPGAIFGLGSGIDQAKLHNPDYDFPDDIIETGINVFYSLYKMINL